MGAMSGSLPTAGAREGTFDPRAALVAVGGLVAAGSVLVGIKIVAGRGIVCPFRALTGHLCPLCGSTSMAEALVHGDVAAAWSHNPVMLIGALLLALASLAWIVELLGGPALRPPARLRPITQRRAYIVGGVILSVFGVLRNLV